MAQLIANNTYLIESVGTGRYLFDSAEDGHVGDKRGDEGGWVHDKIKPAVMSDANYYNKAHWKLVDAGDGKVCIESVATGRYLFDSAEDGHVGDKRGEEGGWVHDKTKPAVMSDANYYNKAYWKLVDADGKFFIESVNTGRYLFDSAEDGHVGDKRGDEGGWVHSKIKPAVMSDANYYNRAYWKFVEV